MVKYTSIRLKVIEFFDTAKEISKVLILIVIYRPAKPYNEVHLKSRNSLRQKINIIYPKPCLLL